MLVKKIKRNGIFTICCENKIHMSVIEITNFSQNYGEKQLFEDANFVLNKGEKIGVTGVNGAGKSTLLKIITGKVLLDKGTLYINPRFTVKYLDQHAEIEQDISIKQYLLQAYQALFAVEKELNEINHQLAVETNEAKLEKLMYRSGDLFEQLQANDFYSIDTNVDKICAGLGVTAFGLDTPVKTLSGGQRAKVILAKILLESPDVMILDEPTNFLDVSHIDWLTKFINNSEKSFLVVSHDYNFLNNIATHICDVDNSEIVKFTGNVDKAMFIKSERRSQLEKSYERQQREIKNLEDYIARNKARASTAGMAQSRVKRLEKMDVIDPPSEHIKPTFSFAEKDFGSNLVLRVEKLLVGYSKPLLKPITFEVNHKERVAITGFNGVGKSTLLKTILGIIPSLGGSLELHKNVVVGYYEQQNEFQNFNGTAITYVQQFYPKLNENQVRTALSKCGLGSTHVKKQMPQLSGGEQSKAKICVITLKPCNLLVLDEPTNHLDVNAIARLKQAIAEFNGTVVFVSHDKQFVSEVATKVLNLDQISV